MVVLPRINLFPLTGLVAPPAAEHGHPSPNAAVAAAAAATATTAAATAVGTFAELVFIVFVPARHPTWLLRVKHADSRQSKR